jgi:hypothetical protein
VQSLNQQKSMGISIVSSSMTKDAKVKSDRLKFNKEYRAYRRANDEAFAESERVSAKKWRDFNNEFNKHCQSFAAAYPSQFQAYVNSGVKAE